MSEALLRRATAYFEAGDLAEAAEVARILVREIDPGLVDAHAMLAQIATAHGRLPLAVGHAGRAALAAPGDAVRRRALMGALDLLASHNASPARQVAGARRLLDLIDRIKKIPTASFVSGGVDIVFPATRPTDAERLWARLAADLALTPWSAGPAHPDLAALLPQVGAIAADSTPAGGTLVLCGAGLMAGDWAFATSPQRVVVPVALADMVTALDMLGTAGFWPDVRLDLVFPSEFEPVALGVGGTVLPVSPEGHAAARRFFFGT